MVGPGIRPARGIDGGMVRVLCAWWATSGRGSGMGHGVMFRVFAGVAVTALAVMTAGCGDGEPEPEETSPTPGVVIVGDADSQTAQPTGEPTGDPTGDPGPGGGSGDGDEPLADDDFVLPDGVTVDEWDGIMADASQVVADYLTVMYESEWDDPDYDAWVTEVEPYVTDSWHDVLMGRFEMSGGGEGARADRELFHESYHVQALRSPLLSYGQELSTERLLLEVPYRMWETSDLAGDRAPWDVRVDLAGVEGTQWTFMELVWDDGAGVWLVNDEDPTKVRGGFYE